MSLDKSLAGNQTTHINPPVIDGYGAEKVLAHSAHSQIWLARTDHLDHQVVLKVFTAAAGNQEARQRFAQEAQIIGKVSSLDGVVTVHRSGFTTLGAPYIAMDHYDRGSLQDFITANNPFSRETVSQVSEFLAAAVSQAHAQGVLHLDIKPGNVLVHSSGRMGLTDFGISRLRDVLDPGVGPVLTPEFAAPELWDPRQTPTAASDVYGVAATLYALVQGRPPYIQAADESDAAFWTRLRSQPLPPLTDSVDPRLALTIMAGLSANLDDRPPLASFFADQSKPGLSQSEAVPVSEPPPAVAKMSAPATDFSTRGVTLESASNTESEAEAPRAKSRKRWVWTGVVVLALLALMMIGTVLSRGSSPSSSTKAQLMTLRPADIVVTEVSGTIHVDWVDHSDQMYPWVVAVQDARGGTPILVTPENPDQQQATATVVSDIDSADPYCFRVGIAIGGQDLPVVWSDESTCINGALPPAGWPDSN